MPFVYSSLPSPSKARYLPQGLKFEWADLEDIFRELGTRTIGSSADLERWLHDEAELDSFIYEQRSLKYINYTLQTDDPAAQKAYEDYTELLEPKVKLAEFELLKKYISDPNRSKLPPKTYGLDSKRRESAESCFRPENVELERKESALSQEYQRVTAAMTVQFRGKERTLQQMSKFYEDNDRTLREEAWRLADSRAQMDAVRLDGVYDKLVGLRDSIARNAGFSGYRDYIFVRKDRFDYTPADCETFHRAVEENMVSLSREIDEERRKDLGLDQLMPWDTRVDPKGRPPLAPFADVKALVSGCGKVIRGVDGQLAGYFSKMADLGLLDLDSRKGKAPGGYQEELTDHGLPFIFMNASGKDTDVRTLLHESGHSFHTFLMHARGLPYFNGGPNLPTEFSEVASMSMELLSGSHLDGAFYDEADARRSNREELVSLVKLFTWVATIDAFQHWVYAHPSHSREERANAWKKTYLRFAGLESFDGLESSLEYRWQRQLHIFEVPFYYIEYGIATIGALGIWLRYKEDPKGAISSYKDALSLGATKSLPELFEAAGVEWDIGPNTIGRLATELRSAIRKLS